MAALVEYGQVTLNGEQRALTAHTLAALLEELDLPAGTLVAEVNGVIVAPADFSATVLKPGDRIELIRFVGGG